jgi:hypothetical protein
LAIFAAANDDFMCEYHTTGGSDDEVWPNNDDTDLPEGDMDRLKLYKRGNKKEGITEISSTSPEW